MTVATRSVLVIHPGALGDVLLSLEAIQTLRRTYPAHQLTLLARFDIGMLLQRWRVVDHALPLESDILASFFAGPGYVDHAVQDLLKSCDYVVAWLDDADQALRNTFTSLGVQRMTLKAPKPQPGVHQSQCYLSTVTNRPFEGAQVRPLHVGVEFLEESSAACRRIGIHDRRFVLCHPGSGSSHKCAPSLIWVRIIESLLRDERSVVIVGGPADVASIEQLKACGLPNLPMITNEPLGTIAALLANADLFVGHDSGVTHLAAAIGVPVVALFGPTNPAQWAPRGRQVTVVTGPPCRCVTWQAVQTCSDKPCLDIPVSAVVQACRSILTRYHPVTKS